MVESNDGNDGSNLGLLHECRTMNWESAEDVENTSVSTLTFVIS